MLNGSEQRGARPEGRARRSWLRWLALATGLGAAGTLGLAAAVIGAWYYVAPGLPAADTIREIPLQIPLRIYSRDGRLIEEIGERKRTLVTYDELPQFVIDAFIAAEDQRFFEHPGVDYRGILRAAWGWLRTGSIEASGGGSTITQQLARDYFLSLDVTLARKLREAFLAWKIEQEFSKQEIFALFVNKMFFGQRSYGVAAAAQAYFDKGLQEINIAEAATLAGVLPAPSYYNPVYSPKNARVRRNYVLRRMHELDFIDNAEFERAMDYPVESRLYGTATELEAPYVAEMVRREMIDRYGLEAAYSSGFKVVTSLDSKLQAAANYALRNGLLEFSRRRGYRGPITHVDVAPAQLAQPFNEWPEALRLQLSEYGNPGGLSVAMVTALHEDNSASVALQDGTPLTLPWHGISWARPYIDQANTGPAPETVADVLSPGDIIYVMPTTGGIWALAQVPEAQAAVVSVDPMDGAITSLSGGFDYSISKFNRVTQAARQPGSAFKPFIYSAALEQGNTPATILLDAPVFIRSSELEAVWRPLNYTGRFYGAQRLREALVHSLNLATVRLLLNKTGIGNAVRHIAKFGFGGAALPYNGSLALGGGNATPLDMAQAYATFANGGYAVEPYIIQAIFNAEGKALYRADPAVVCRRCEVDEDARRRREPSGDLLQTVAMSDAEGAPQYGGEAGLPMPLEQMAELGTSYRPDANEAPQLFEDVHLAPRVISAQNAYLIQDMMHDVIRRGTGRRARQLGRSDLSGKTGTSNDQRDAWFAGFNSMLSVVTWVGYDDPKPLGPGEQGSRTALPLWIDFMAVALDGVPPSALPMPEGMTSVKINKKTGCPATAADPADNVMFEIFRVGHEPECEYSDEHRDIFNQSGDEEAAEPIF
ncbi:MAG TPA: PBP1A family penicillin-binding protein [Woeseiaceae bacterium]|nr:PBP1A family penicillin-binding protein [Woeseiaceae bacterium]